MRLLLLSSRFVTIGHIHEQVDDVAELVKVKHASRRINYLVEQGVFGANYWNLVVLADSGKFK